MQAPMHNYLSVVVPDINYTLNITPQNVLVESSEIYQLSYMLDDGTVERIASSEDMFFIVSLQWEKVEGVDAETIWDCWQNVVSGTLYTFKWLHPLDGYTYIVRFMGSIEKELQPSTTKGIREIKLKVEGKVS